MIKPGDKVTKLTPREWLLSVAAHALVFALLLLLIPAGQVETFFSKDAAKAREESYRDPSQVQDVVKEIANEQAAAAREHVAELIDLEKKLNDLTKDRVDQYHEKAKAIAADAAQQALEQLQKIPAVQDTTLQAQDQLAQKLQQAFPTNAPPSMDAASLHALRDQVSALQQQVSQSQSATQEQQDKATQLLHFVTQDSPTSDAQGKADEAETTAALTQQKAIQMQDRLLEHLNNIVRQSDAVTKTTAAVTVTQAQIDQENQALTQDNATTDAAKTALDAAKAVWQQASDLARTTKLPADRQTSEDTRRAFLQAEQKWNQSRGQANQDTQAISGLQRQLTAHRSDEDKATTRMTQLQAQFAPLQAELQADADKSKQEQTAAKQAQVDALTQLAALEKNPVPPPPGATAQADEPVPDQASLQSKDLGQLYQTARQIEDHVTDKYKTYRAAELASIQKLTLSDALQATQVARPDREQLNVRLLSSHGATKDFTGYKTEVTKANQQIQSMVALTSDMVSTAEAQKDVGQGDIQVQQGQYDQMVAAATDDPNAVGKDLTGKGNLERPADADKSSTTTPPPQATVAELPNMDYIHLKPFATRQISESGPNHADWLYVDSWYLIGPFPNEGRRNLYSKFPPESIIDLDAVYSGKNARPLHWVYTQWNSPMLSPHNDVADAPAIYYAYTELFFDKAEDLWIASGSDDKGTMWLNDLMVWNSNDTLKAWSPNEGYRKVHFKQGRNRILYRLENGQLVAAFSLMISSRQN